MKEQAKRFGHFSIHTVASVTVNAVSGAVLGAGVGLVVGGVYIGKAIISR